MFHSCLMGCISSLGLAYLSLLIFEAGCCLNRLAFDCFHAFWDCLFLTIGACMQVRLLSMLDEYNFLRQEKDEEKRRLRVRTRNQTFQYLS